MQAPQFLCARTLKLGKIFHIELFEFGECYHFDPNSNFRWLTPLSAFTYISSCSMEIAVSLAMLFIDYNVPTVAS
jgi:hypothetical protein